MHQQARPVQIKFASGKESLNANHGSARPDQLYLQQTLSLHLRTEAMHTSAHVPHGIVLQNDCIDCWLEQNGPLSQTRRVDACTKVANTYEMKVASTKIANTYKRGISVRHAVAKKYVPVRLKKQVIMTESSPNNSQQSLPNAEEKEEEGLMLAQRLQTLITI